jgi:serine/threonine protein kinase
MEKIDVALKHLKYNQSEEFAMEVSTLRQKIFLFEIPNIFYGSQLNHPNIVRIFGLYNDPRTELDYIVLEYAAKFDYFIHIMLTIC